MAKLLFRMRDVPDDEAEEVRELLTQNGIPFFETFAGNWGISMPGLWLVNEQQFDEARALLDEYQEIRSTRVKSQYLKQREQGEIRTFLESFRAEPVRFSVYLGLTALVLYLSLRFFVSF
ncbi:MAG: DUF6164 family protein [Pseudomonadota bacterium]|nr:DUF6164 family protein [Pseudomonadota bacterium]|tara:strand:+ start:134 stop:493 length:360 start_codon:yes stop_codon:yes gene_type:complete